MVDHPEYRLSADERAEAIRLLDEHYRAGRLDPEEYEERRGQAMDAVTRADLAVLFADLPTQPAVVAGSATAVVAPTRPGRDWREAVLGLLPLLALLLFFTTGRWWWFLLIPVAAIILRSGSGGARS